MEKIIIYDLLLVTMLFLLFKAGGRLRRKWKIFSQAGISAILIYALNEGLRFGRGIDYNAYWKVFDRIAAGESNDSMYVNMDIGFFHFCKALSLIGFSWQGCVLIMSLIFIISSLQFLKSYRDSIRFALPLWVLFSFSQTENVMRWFVGFSLILIGLSLIMQKHGKKFYLYYLLLSGIGCTVHLGLIPVAIFLVLMTFKETPLIKPMYLFLGLVITIIIAQVGSLLGYFDLFNMFASMSNRFSEYAEDTEYWLLKASSVGSLYTFTGIIDFLCSLFVAAVGYKACANAGKNYAFAYNLFIIAFLFRPITTQMELLNRYDTLFYSFRAIVYARILLNMVMVRQLKRKLEWEPIMAVVMFINIAQPVLVPFRNDPRKYLYYWDKGNLTADKMYQVYFNDKK